MRGGDLFLLRTIIERIWNDAALRFAISAAFGVASLDHFSDEIVELLSSAKFMDRCYKDRRLLRTPACRAIVDNDLAFRVYGISLSLFDIVTGSNPALGSINGLN